MNPFETNNRHLAGKPVDKIPLISGNGKRAG